MQPKRCTFRMKGICELSSNTNEEIYVGIDVGTTKVATVIGLKEPNSPGLSVIGVGRAKNSGVFKGTVKDIEETVTAIITSIEEAERMAGNNIRQVTLGLNGSGIATAHANGVVAVSRADQQVTITDVNRAIDQAKATALPPSNREVITILPRHFKLDDHEITKDPVGMKGIKLEAQTLVISGVTQAIKNLDNVVRQAGVAVEGRVLNPLAAAKSVLTKQQKELGCVVVDIGGGTTTLAVFEEGELIHLAVIPVGSASITNDLAIGLRTSIEIAEKIKLKHGFAPGTKKIEKGDTFKVDELEESDNEVSIKEFAFILDARLDEIFALVAAELGRIGKQDKLPGGAILTGGGANLAGIESYAKEKLKLPTTKGRAQETAGLVDKVADPGMAVAVGLMLMSASGEQAGFKGANESIGKAVDKLRLIFKKFLP